MVLSCVRGDTWRIRRKRGIKNSLCNGERCETVKPTVPDIDADRSYGSNMFSTAGVLELNSKQVLFPLRTFTLDCSPAVRLQYMFVCPV